MKSIIYYFINIKIKYGSYIFPSLFQSKCYFKQKFKGLALNDKIWKTTIASIVPTFYRKNANVYDLLGSKPIIHWSRSHFDTSFKCNLLLNNLWGSFNSTFVEAR